VREREENDENETTYAAQAARVLAAAQSTTVPPPLQDRAESIAAIERALRARGQRPWPRRWATPALATLAAAAAVVLVARVRPGHPGASLGGLEAAKAPAIELTAGAELRGPTSLVLATGTRLNLDGPGRVHVLDGGLTQRLGLEAGRLTAEVAKLTPGRRFIVQTPDAEVEVKGTRFDVTVAPVSADCVPATQTRVMVREGVVAVRFAGVEQRLQSGESWPVCGSSETAAKVVAAPVTARPSLERAALVSRAPRAAKRAEVLRAGVSAPGLVSPAPAALSTLAEQNDLLAASLAARQRGDVKEALQWLDRLLGRYPDGQLAGSARAERRRLLDGGAGPRERDPK
jgi:ferric-dicitrate binding protein FerR (iron transport regulator)